MAQATTRPKKLIYTTMKGVFVFPKLNEPDFKFKADGEYSNKLRVSLTDAQPLIEKLDPLYVEAIRDGEAAHKALKLENDKKKKKTPAFQANPLFEEVMDGENETDDVAFKFGMAAGGTDKKTGKKWDRKPTIFNAKGVPLKNPPPIWGGTIGKVSFSVAPYFIPATGAAGLKLRLEAAQIIELRSSGGRDAAGYGFGAEEGYEGGDEPEETPATDAAATAPASEDEPF